MPLTYATLVLLLISLVAIHSAEAQTFHGYPCTVDCSGHEAGYEWAERKNIDSTYDCHGNSNSFNEGCEAYVEEQKREEEQQAEEEGRPAEE